ncbi:uncharacterized protein V6R79_018539 [Siganus canaliculatus]
MLVAAAAQTNTLKLSEELEEQLRPGYTLWLLLSQTWRETRLQEGKPPANTGLELKGQRRPNLHLVQKATFEMKMTWKSRNDDATGKCER